MKQTPILKYLILILLITFSNAFCKPVDTLSVLDSLEIPKYKPTDEIVRHRAYILSYNEVNEEANWVAYILTKEHTIAKFKRSNKFMVDPLVITGSANDADYKGYPYDRGHLAPAQDMAWSKVTLDESFYYSNMTTQVPSFNRGVWKRLETRVRKWAKEYQKLFIVTGPVLGTDLPYIGHHKVRVPKYFYKVILVYSREDKKAIGFIVPNKASKKSLTSFVVTVDSVQHLTGINFYPLLPPADTTLEYNVDLTKWDFK